MVKAVHDELNFVVGKILKAFLFRKVLSNQAVRIFNSTPLPGGIRVSKVRLCLESLGQLNMLGEFSAIVGCQGVNAGCKRSAQGDHGGRRSLRRLERDMGDLRVPAFHFIR